MSNEDVAVFVAFGVPSTISAIFIMAMIYRYYRIQTNI